MAVNHRIKCTATADEHCNNSFFCKKAQGFGEQYYFLNQRHFFILPLAIIHSSAPDIVNLLVAFYIQCRKVNIFKNYSNWRRSFFIRVKKKLFGN